MQARKQACSPTSLNDKPKQPTPTTPYSQDLQFCQKQITYSETSQARNNYDILI